MYILVYTEHLLSCKSRLVKFVFAVHTVSQLCAGTVRAQRKRGKHRQLVLYAMLTLLAAEAAPVAAVAAAAVLLAVAAALPLLLLLLLLLV
jgi:hypothetical protein